MSPSRLFARARRAAGAAVAAATAVAAVAAVATPAAHADALNDAAHQAAAMLEAQYPNSALTPLVADALNGINGPLGNPGPPAPVNVDVNCRPTPAHPNPVILVHGTFDDGAQAMSTFGRPLVDRGFCVVAPTVGAYIGNPDRGELDSVAMASGPQLASVIDQVKAVTGAPQVDLVGYSQGAAVAGFTTKVLRPGSVAHVVSLAGYWGSDMSGVIPVPLPPGAAELALYSVNLRGLSELFPGTPTVTAWYGLDHTPYLPGVQYTLIASQDDNLLPPSRSFVAGPGVALDTVQDYCPADPSNHGSITTSVTANDLVAAGLGDNQGVRCA